MAACGQALSSCNWKWSDCPHGFPQPQLHSFNLNSTFLNSLSLSASLGSSSKCGRAFVPVGAALRAFRQHHFSPVWAILLQYCSPSSARCLKARKKVAIERHVSSRISLSQRDGLQTLAVASGLVSPDGTSKSTMSEHVEQLEEFYLENDVLFVDETWGALGKDGECSSGISTLVEEKLSSVLAAGRLQRGSRVLVWGGSAAFARELCVATSPTSLVVVHLSMSVLATIKEMNDDVICWLGDIQQLPNSYGPFDSVFLNSIITTAYSPAALLRGVASLCKPGARIVISCIQGRKDLDACRDKNPQLVIQDLPDASDLQRMINPLPLIVVGLQDESSFYLATVEVEGSSRGLHTGNDSGEVSGSTPIRDNKTFPLPASGKVVQGFGRGSRQMGIPTANINPEELPRAFLELPKGVYFGWAQQHSADEMDGGVYKMVMNIGSRPTFADGDGVTVEVHILHNFSSDFYGKQLSVIVLGFIRAEMQFKSLDELVQRIKADIITADKLLDQDEMLQYASDVLFAR